MLERAWRRGSLPDRWKERKFTQTLRRTTRPAAPLRGHKSRRNSNSKRHRHAYVHSTTSHYRGGRESSYMSVGRRTEEEMWEMETMECYSAVNTDGITPQHTGTQDKTETGSQTQETGLWASRGVRVGDRWTGSSGLADANYYTQKAQTTTYYTARGSICKILGYTIREKNMKKEMYIYMHN